MKQIVHCISDTTGYGCCYKKGSMPEPVLIGFSDNDLAGDVGDRKSTTGIVFFPGPVLRFRGPWARLKIGALNINITMITINIIRVKCVLNNT